MNKLKIGLLGLYIKLYDEVSPDFSPRIEKIYMEMAERLEAQGFQVVTAPVGRVRKDFEAACSIFEKEDVQAIATLHLAYSPSLESAAVIAGSPLPVVILDTTYDYEFGFDFGGRIMLNHGIHGVQDFCNLLIRSGKPFLIAAGHPDDSGYMEKAAGKLRTACMFSRMSGMRVGAIGGDFEGMGDFAVPPADAGLVKVPFDAASAPEADPAETAALCESVRRKYDASALSDDVLAASCRAAVRIRKWMEAEKLDAFTACFCGITRTGGWETVPFFAASLAMAEGKGYAGEGDVVTAGLTAAFLSKWPETTFAEMFCPDWKNQRIFISHMGEVNLDLLERCALTEKPYAFSDTGNPVIPEGHVKAGSAVFTCLAPLGGGRFRLIAAPVDFVSPDTGYPGRTVCGWFTVPSGNIADFLEKWSRLGGIHHGCVVFGADLDSFEDFALLNGWEFSAVM